MTYSASLASASTPSLLCFYFLSPTNCTLFLYFRTTFSAPLQHLPCICIRCWSLCYSNSNHSSYSRGRTPSSFPKIFIACLYECYCWSTNISFYFNVRGRKPYRTVLYILRDLNDVTAIAIIHLVLSTIELST